MTIPFGNLEATNLKLRIVINCCNEENSKDLDNLEYELVLMYD